MARDWCLIIRPADTASVAEIGAIKTAFEAGDVEIEWRREGSDFVVYVDSLDDPEHGEPAVEAMLERRELMTAVRRPFSIGRWSETHSRYIVSDPPQSPNPFEPVVAPNEIGWGVYAEPVSAFDRRALCVTLHLKGRFVLSESDEYVEVGARDEADAKALIEELASLPLVRQIFARPFGRIRRWRVRQQLVGNYQGSPDPTSSLLDVTKLF